MSLTLESPVPGTFGWELISLVSDYINDFKGSRILEVRDDKLIIHDCKELGRLITHIISNHVSSSAHVFMSGNDFNYVLKELAELARLPPKPPIQEIIKSYGEIMKQKGGEVPALTQLYAIPAMLGANFYEYGKSYLKKPTKRLKPKSEISGGSVILGYLGGLLCYAGDILKPEKTRISFYFLPNRKIIDWVMMRELASVYRKLVVRDYSDASILIHLIASLFEKGVIKSDSAFGSMFSLQEAQRCTILSVNSMHTSGLISVMNRITRITGLKEELIAFKIKSLMSAPMRVGGEEGDALMRLVERLSSYLLAYASTESPEPLSMLISLLDRTLSDLQLGSKSVLSNGLRIWAGSEEDAIKELRSLISIFSSIRLIV